MKKLKFSAKNIHFSKVFGAIPLFQICTQKSENLKLGITLFSGSWQGTKRKVFKLWNVSYLQTNPFPQGGARNQKRPYRTTSKISRWTKTALPFAIHNQPGTKVCSFPSYHTFSRYKFSNANYDISINLTRSKKGSSAFSHAAAITSRHPPPPE